MRQAISASQLRRPSGSWGWAIITAQTHNWPDHAWASLLATVALLLMYYNTGYSQSGYRFSMDFMLPLICLTALGSRKKVSRWMIGLILFGIVVNFIGMLWYYKGWC